MLYLLNTSLIHSYINIDDGFISLVLKIISSKDIIIDGCINAFNIDENNINNPRFIILNN